MTRTVVITGATSGIGRAAARTSAGRRDRLVLAARSPAPLAEVREECRAAGAPVLVVPTDVTTPDAVDGLARATLREVWVGRLSVVRRFGFSVLPGVHDVLVGPLMRLAGLSNRSVAPHDGR
ncbi:SDR family NAD(P)-dependent oxidoreductase [Micromonospora sp. RTP1Z1]|uniref:SDR family NAD(P)-dependent oxidoreductase n=1 Tax=Micromonospora sp. RTP1Z1 TaxID=2994043 RepID=UPI0029C70941|nr:SDR family NAD(P)-dependent oxidoreductase [Micromonospora sp. RTP1Z1]